MKRHKKRRGRKKQYIILLISIELLLIIGGFLYFQQRPMVAKAVTVEAGEQKLEVETFLLNKNREGSFLTDITTISTSIPGSYEVKLMVEDKVHTSLLEIVDTIAPTATVSDQLALLGEVVDPGSFITEMSDATQINLSYKKLPDTSVPGEQEVTIILEDSGKNRIEKTAILVVLDIKSSIVVEAGSQRKVTVADFVNIDHYNITSESDIQSLDFSKPITHRIDLTVNGRTLTGYIEVVDTTAPKATVVNQQVWKGEVVEAMTFIKEIEDASTVIVTYKEEPDFTRLGDQQLTLILKDDSENTTELPVTMTVAEDTQAPVIQGASDKLAYIGDSVSYKKGVYVTDNKDKELSFSVDSSKVNLKQEGIYAVTYSAKDAAGNKGTKTINVEVKKFVVTEDMVNELCDDILAQISNSSMTNRETAYAIYRWIKKHIGYSGDSDKSDWLAEAYRAVKNGNGDCFTYFAIAQALLTRAGIDNMEVIRVGGRTRHYWNLVNCGDGWYHFDSCPNKDHMESFMLTDKQVEEYTQQRGNNYYNFDKSLYPATPE
ncbi:MAG: hypothetical protein K0R46_2672 [Herbinix sp.]|nr:hypothetical protein [Herbinix sp.]